ncbi:YfcZ/YiiS family protein [Shewanella seohaensis]|uniref:DUF406 family protein n=1 Tax=Shewanella seohaensis TaxID=755175 RepID=UPI00200BCDDF|nr:DUF406 family protein [Shewanella seohaensis]MCL1121167.1 YfcZ/YiiS family protein [Shewanella seohaensis]UXM80728.1 YfcZ/YiiS family protein [Shewanella seohaensis]
MKGIIAGQAATVNDTCTDCGSFVDIGAVIDEQDTVLELSFAGAEAEVEATKMLERAQARFSQAQGNIVQDEVGVTLKLVFDVSVEKMIFQLENGL